VASRHSCHDGAGNRGFLAQLSEQDREAFERLGRRASFPAGTALMHEGLDMGGVMLLLAGNVKATSISVSGREQILAFRGPGDVIGELAAVDDRPHSGTVVAMEPVEALIVPSRDFEAFLEHRPKAAIALLRTVIDRFRDTDRKLVEFGASDSLGRVASRLVELSESHGEPTDRGIAIALHLSQDELAGWAGCSPKAVVNALQTLRTLGLIETGRRRITVLDADGLRARAQA
jgi:CRP/FNR family transcriptional regulator, cyclic AMP receptor protein